jgi:predicted nucleic acid-binding protein
MEQKVIIVDSNIIIEYLNGNASIIKLLADENYLVFISCITKAEVQQGAANKVHLNKINRALEPFPVIELDYTACQLFNDIFSQYLLSRQCSIPDMLIAATAIRYDIELFTFNLKDFGYLPQLRLLQHNIKPLKKDGWFW